MKLGHGRQTATHRLHRALALVVAMSATGCALPRDVLFPAPRPIRTPSLDGASLLRIPGPDHTTVYALYAPPTANAPTVVHFHGNGEQLADVVPLVRRLHERGFGVLAMEYPGYGLAWATPPSELALYGAAEAVLAYLHTTLGVPTSRTVLEGQSLGTGVAAEMAARGRGMRLVLVSPYTSIDEVVCHAAPLLSSSLVVRDRFDTAAKAPRIAVPVLIVHGTDDEVIPFAMGRQLSPLFPRASFMAVPHGHHNDLWAQFGAGILDRIAAFARGG